MNKNKVWFITGSNSGFGRSLTEAVLAKGDRVIATARHTEELDDIVKQYPNNVKVVCLDVTKSEEISAAIDTALTTFNSIDVVCNIVEYGNRGAVGEIGDEKIYRQFEVNYFGTLNLTRAFLPYLRQKRSGHIFNISSIIDFACLPGIDILFSTKYAIERFSEALTKDLETLGIKLTIVEARVSQTNFGGDCLITNNQIDACVEISCKFIEQEKSNARQLDSFNKVVQEMIKVIDFNHPPLHLILEKNVLKRVRSKQDFFQTESEKEKSASLFD